MIEEEQKQKRLENLKKIFPDINNAEAVDAFAVSNTEYILGAIEATVKSQKLMEPAAMQLALMFYLHGNISYILKESMVGR